MRRLKDKKLIIGLLFAAFLSLVVYLAWPNNPQPAAQTAAQPPSNSGTAVPPATFNKNQYPTDQADSLWVVVNKGRQLPSSYTPANLVVPSVPLRLSASSSEMQVRIDAAAAMEKMFAAAKTEGINLMLASGYRSYAAQVSVYGGYVSASGAAQADTFSARPGHSEHQTGLAADIEPLSRDCEVEQCFESTPEGQWLAANSYKYGFIIRYQKNTQALTGYEYEPWHVRYVGLELAGQIHQTGQTLEQFFGLPNYSTYPAKSLIL
jgi:D-alanyl-D-alanine carboxypeptidase